jgi:class 3 adenylate cyclase
MGALPSGIVAFLMTDVVASSRAWNGSPADMEAALGSLDADVHGIAATHNGSVVKARGEGDSHFVAFSEASQAIRAAADLQRRGDERLSVRACVLVGEARPRDGDYVGALVNHGARIRSVAHGGQVVVTSTAAAVASGHLPDDLTFRTLGTHRIRDIPDPIELCQLWGPGLRSSFPPPSTPAFTSSTMMAVVAVDEVRATRRLERGDEQVFAWQRDLIHTLRELSDAHDGRHLKLLGDGCLVAFEDPRSARAFAERLQRLAIFRIGVSLGLVEAVEGELTGRTVYRASALMRTAGAGELRCCAVMEAVCAPAPGATYAEERPNRPAAGVSGTSSAS